MLLSEVKAGSSIQWAAVIQRSSLLMVAMGYFDIVSGRLPLVDLVQLSFDTAFDVVTTWFQYGCLFQ